MAHRTALSTLRALAFGVLSLASSLAFGQAARQFSFAYDQPPSTAYGIAANIFDAKLKELSGGKLSINQFPGGQLGQEPPTLQQLRAGDQDRGHAVPGLRRADGAHAVRRRLHLAADGRRELRRERRQRLPRQQA